MCAPLFQIIYKYESMDIHCCTGSTRQLPPTTGHLACYTQGHVYKGSDFQGNSPADGGYPDLAQSLLPKLSIRIV